MRQLAQRGRLPGVDLQVRWEVILGVEFVDAKGEGVSARS